ncbi:hypothetical protein AAZX31_20G223100 [Glycine max]
MDWKQYRLGPKNMDCGFLLLLLFFHLFLPHSSGKPSGVCVSQGGRFPPFKSEGGAPKNGPKDLTLCRIFRKKTCCDVTHTHPALLSVRKLASTGEATQECLHLWELLECSICDPRVGFRVKPSDIVDIASEETSCYGDKASLGSVVDSWKASQFELTEKGESLRMLDDFQQWAREMPFGERVSWAIGGMVLTAGLMFISKRKSHNQRQKLAAIKRTARKLESRMMEQRPSNAQENRRVSR